MSKAERQVLTMLCLLSACLNTYMRTNAFAKVEMKNLVTNLRLKTIMAMNKWIPKPADAKEEKKHIKALKKMNQDVVAFEKFLKTEHRLEGATAIAAFGEEIIATILHKVQNKNRVALIEVLAGPVAEIHNFRDPEGNDLLAYDMAKKAMDKLHLLIKWEW